MTQVIIAFSGPTEDLQFIPQLDLPVPCFFTCTAYCQLHKGIYYKLTHNCTTLYTVQFSLEVHIMKCNCHTIALYECIRKALRNKNTTSRIRDDRVDDIG